MQVDAIVVCSTSNGLLKSVLDVAGPGVNQNFHKPKNRNQERALILPAVKLPFKKIVFIPWRPDAVTGLSIENSVRNFVITAIELAVKNKCNTLSFPAIGELRFLFSIKSGSVFFDIVRTTNCCSNVRDKLTGF